jgi:hypothetical protein
MRSLGWRIDNDNAANKAKATRWTIKPPDKGGNSNPPDPPDPPPQASDPLPGGIEDDPLPVGGLDDPPARQADPVDPQVKDPLTSHDGLAGHAGQQYGPSLGSTDHRILPDGRIDCPHCGPVILCQHTQNYLQQTPDGDQRPPA